MSTYLWTMVVLFGLDVIGKTIWLYTRDTERSLGHTAFDLIVCVGMLVWTVYVLEGLR